MRDLRIAQVRMQIIAIRSSALFLLSVAAILRMRKKDPDLRIFGEPSSCGKLFVRGVAGAATLILYYVSIKLLPLGDAVAIFFTNGVLASSASVLMGDDIPTWALAAACLLSTGKTPPVVTVVSVDHSCMSAQVQMCT